MVIENVKVFGLKVSSDSISDDIVEGYNSHSQFLHKRVTTVAIISFRKKLSGKLV